MPKSADYSKSFIYKIVCNDITIPNTYTGSSITTCTVPGPYNGSILQTSNIGC